jgi:hypothetical protein
MKLGYCTCYNYRNFQGLKTLVTRRQIGPNLGLSRYKPLTHLCAALHLSCREKFTFSIYGRRYGRLRCHYTSLLCYIRVCTGMSETKKIFLHADQKKCVTVLLPKSVLVTLTICVNDAKCTALFKDQ